MYPAEYIEDKFQKKEDIEPKWYCGFHLTQSDEYSHKAFSVAYLHLHVINLNLLTKSGVYSLQKTCPFEVVIDALRNNTCKIDPNEVVKDTINAFGKTFGKAFKFEKRRSLNKKKRSRKKRKSLNKKKRSRKKRKSLNKKKRFRKKRRSRKKNK